MKETPSWFQALGAATLARVRYLVELWQFCTRSLAAMVQGGGGISLIRDATFRQIYFTGVQALPVVCVLGVLLGTVIMVQTIGFLPGSSGTVAGTLVDVLLVDQLGPLMTAVIVVQRSGSAICIELGSMRVRGELDLLELLGIDPFRYLVLPRMVGVTYAVLCLGVFFDLVALVGGYAVSSVLIGPPGPAFLAQVIERLTLQSVLSGLFKTAVFGLIIATLSAYHGLSCRRSQTEVPIACQKAMVHSLVLCVGVAALVTVASFSKGAL